MNNAASIDVQNVSVTYSNGQNALSDVSFDLHGGTICALVGVNGSGKSTLFKTLMDFIKPDQGHVRLKGMSVRAALKQNLVSYVPQSEDVDWNFPVLVEDVVMMGRYGHMGFLRRARQIDHNCVNDALERVNMSEYRKRQIGELSGGQKKRVFIARALAQGGDIILLDEPFTGVDVKTENAIIDLMRDLRAEGQLILVSTHNLGSVPNFCDHVILINREILAVGPIESTFTESNLALAFGGMLRHIHLEGRDLHDDEDPRSVMVITDDERPLVLYGKQKDKQIVKGMKDKKKQDK